MAPALGYTYCTRTDIENLLSTQGVTNRIQTDQQVTDAITDASETCNFYLWGKYDPANLTNSNWVNRRAAKLAAYVVCGYKGNPVPDTVIEWAEKAEEELKAVADGPRILPGIPLRRALAPRGSNIRFDPRYQFKCIRVERRCSPASGPQDLPKQVDYQEAYTFEYLI